MFIGEEDTTFQALWAKAAAPLQRALERGGDGAWELEDVKHAVMVGQMQFWPLRDGAAITQIITYPRKKVLHWFLAAGTLEEILELLPALQAFARSHGCYAIQGGGRKGWTHIAQSAWFKKENQFKYMLEVTDG